MLLNFSASLTTSKKRRNGFHKTSICSRMVINWVWMPPIPPHLVKLQ